LSLPLDPFIGRTIGGCRIVERIGRGAMAVVYKAEQLSLNRIVALKLLDERATGDSEAIPRFYREARSAARLIHANVVQIYDVGVDQGIPYIAMEYVDGETLYDRLAREGRIPAAEALEIVRQAALALVRAEEFGIVHRDIKPANIMVSRRGEAKLADFGLAKSAGDRTVTQTGGGALGTPYYMSPEQAEGARLDARSDIYSLGATFYHLVTGRPPYQGPSTAAIIVAHASEPLVPACEVEKSVPRAVSDLIDRMMAKRPQDRYPSARALLAAIASVKRALAEGLGDRPKPRTDIQPAVGSIDRRAYRRVSADFVAEMRPVEGSPEELEAVRRRVKNLSKGGLFVETEALLTVGSVVEMRFRLGPRAGELRALGVVRWTSSGPGRPGMGIQFLELEAPVAGEVSRYVESRAEDSQEEALKELMRTPLHEAFLRLHAASLGDALRLSEIARRLDSSQGLVRLVVRAFEAKGLVILRGEIVQFLVPSDEALRKAIARRLEGTGAQAGDPGGAK